MPKVELVTDLVTNPLVEQWIDLNTTTGKPSTFKTIRHEGDSEYVYPKRVEGIRYKSFGLHHEADGYHVTHCPTGGLCGPPFSSEKDARRFIFCVMNLAKWHKITWSDDPPYLDDPKLLKAVKEALNYCRYGEGRDIDCSTLLELIKPHVSTDVDEEVELEPVAFGSTAKTSTKTRQKQPVLSSSESSGWGKAVTGAI
jgi:hypothetical protein